MGVTEILEKVSYVGVGDEIPKGSRYGKIHKGKAMRVLSENADGAVKSIVTTKCGRRLFYPATFGTDDVQETCRRCFNEPVIPEPPKDRFDSPSRLYALLVESIKATGKTQKELSDLSGLSEKHVSQMLNHKIGALKTWEKLLEAAGVEL